ncbi:hypothetical protein AJ88_42520 [Mesorhizobium amorphae CCBAU 01583]|nr:hypothetical protein AJ88_42520 [Mesorhizobium amorphae CCBAU 01583]
MLAFGCPRRVDGRRLTDDQHRLVRQHACHRLLIGARHGVERRRKMHIGECRSSAPARQSGNSSNARWIIIVPGAYRNFFIAASKPASPDPSGKSLPVSALGATLAMTVLLAIWKSPEASRTPVALPPATVISATSAPVAILPPAAVTMPDSARIMVSAPPLPSTMPKA